MFEGDSQSERQDSMTNILRGLSARYGVWAVTNNHESHGGRNSSVRFFEDSGIHVLRNEWNEILPGLALVGVDDGGHRESSVTSADRFGQMLAGPKSQVPVNIKQLRAVGDGRPGVRGK
jgi:predicted MPP superfamily phosphohydrolase